MVNSVVAPLVGARIEIRIRRTPRQSKKVAPLVGARIEIEMLIDERGIFVSLPLWERGLKYKDTTGHQ